MEALENAIVTANDELATLYARPSGRALKKGIDHVDTVGRAFIAASPFLVLETGSSAPVSVRDIAAAKLGNLIKNCL